MENHSTTTSVQNIRLQHISHEVSIQSIAKIYLLNGVMSFGMIFIMIFRIGFLGLSDLEFILMRESMLYAGTALPAMLFVLGFVWFCTAQLLIGLALYRLDASAKMSATVLACVGLCVGLLEMRLALYLDGSVYSIINGYMLYLIHSAKGKVVMGPDYAAVRAATPGIKYRSNWLVLILMIIILILIILCIMYFNDIVMSTPAP